MSNVSDLERLIDVLLESDREYGLMVLGGPGIGKTYSVLRYLAQKKVEYEIMRTYTTPLALYMWLYEHRDDRLVVFDDTEGIWEDDHSASIMKSALWEDDGERRIEWHSSSKIIQMLGINSFVFNAKVIFICNKTRDNPHINAVLSRVLYYKFTYTRQQLIDEMRKICEGYTGFKLDKFEKLEVLDIIDKFASVFDFRTLMHGFSIREYCKLNNRDDWKTTFLSVLEGDANKEYKFVIDLSKSQLSVEEQAKKYMEEFGKSRRSFYYLRQKLREIGCL